MQLTPTQRLADRLLDEQGETLRSFVLSRADLGVPGEAIARQLADATDVHVTGEAVRRWIRQFRDEREPAA